MTPERWMALSDMVPLAIWFAVCAVLCFKLDYYLLGGACVAALIGSLAFLVRRWRQTAR